MEENVKRARNFRNYKVWQDAVDYATKVYKITSEMPWFEKKGLCDQLQRAVVSISSNIAEGAAKPSDIAFEVETQLLIAKNVGYLRSKNNDNLNVNNNNAYNDNGGVVYEDLLSELQEIERQINGLISKLRD